MASGSINLPLASGSSSVRTLKTGSGWTDDYIALALASETNWSSFSNGTGAALAKQAGESGHPGITRISTGTTSTGRCGHIKDAAAIQLGSGVFTVDCIFRINQLSTSTDEFNFRIGLGDQTGDVDQVDGVSVKYLRTVSGNYFICETSSNSSRTAVVLDGSSNNPTVAVSASQWYFVRIVVDNGNTASFYIDTAAGNTTLQATITTNIPTSTGRQCNPVHGIFKSAGTTACTYDIDAYSFDFVGNR